MRTNLLACRSRALSRASAICAVAVAGLTAACSNDVARLDNMMTASVVKTNNQHQIMGGERSGSEAYAERYETSVDGIRVSRPPSAYGTAPSAVNRTNLPPVVPPGQLYGQAQSGLIVLQPTRAQDNALRVGATDPMTTSSVVPVNAPKPGNGWDNKSGAWVTVRSGETLYNISRRYGVPVSAIMKANSMSDGNAVVAGSRILIPTYQYSSAAPVSAPDHNPVTRASRASRGFQGQAQGALTVPKTRSQNLAAQLPKAQSLQPPKSALANPFHYTVQKGDTLSGIARRNGLSMASIKAANNMDSDVVRLGQRLAIPGSDSVVTGSIPTSKSKAVGVKSVVQKTTAPVVVVKQAEPVKKRVVASVGSQFRWPAEGRIISKFGERVAGGVNDGIDISVPVGTPIKASETGTVIYSGSELEDFGNLILLSHEGGWVSAYAHASATLVRRGQRVNRGQVIAKSGRSGNAAVPKVHFELRKNSNPVNPLKHLAR